MENKFAEKLSILQQHGQGLLDRLFFTMKYMKGKDTRPRIFSEKAFESQIKSGLKKFPQIDQLRTKGGVVDHRREELMKVLGPHYMVLVDIMNFKDKYFDVLTAMGAHQLDLDVRLNTELTVAFFELTTSVIALMVVLSRFEERKTIAACFTVVHELFKGNSEPNFPRLATLLLDYDSPIKRFVSDFRSHEKLLGGALQSLKPHFDLNYRDAGLYRKDFVLSVNHNTAKMKMPVESEYPVLEMFSMDRIVHWTLLGYLVVPYLLLEQEAAIAVISALADGYTLTLYRTQTLEIHHAFDQILSSLKEPKKFSKLKNMCSDQLAHAISHSPQFHAQRRAFLRDALDQLLCMMMSNPALLGPQMTVVVRGLSMARDEVCWLLRHMNASVPKSKSKLDPRVFQDVNMGQLFFYMMELIALIRSNKTLVQKYFSQYLLQFDAEAMNQAFAGIQLSGTGNQIIQGFQNTIKSLERNQNVDFSGFRLDWLRVCAAMSSKSSEYPLRKHRLVSKRASLACFHTMFIDNLDVFLREHGMVKELWYYRKNFSNFFEATMKSPAHVRYAMAFVQMCDCFSDNPTDFLRSEKSAIATESIALAESFLNRICNTTTSVLSQLASHTIKLGEEIMPEHAARVINVDKKERAARAPGVESHQDRHNENVFNMSRQQQILTDLGWAVNHQHIVEVDRCAFFPRQYQISSIRSWIDAALTQLIQLDNDSCPPRPSVVLNRVKSFVAGIRVAESFISMDVSGFFAEALLAQTMYDEVNKSTFTTVYVNFYVDNIVKFGGPAQILFSESRRCLVSKPNIQFKAESYTDASELRALCSLIGPFGIKLLNERLVSRIGPVVGEMKSLITKNPKLVEVAMKSEQHAVCEDALKNLEGVDHFTRVACFVGLILEFRNLLMDALAAVLKDRIPFVFSTVSDLHQHIHHSPAIDMLALTVGERSQIDPQLVFIIAQHATQQADDYQAWMLIMTMFGAAIRYIAMSSSHQFLADMDAFDGNAVCMASAAHHLSCAMLSSCAQEGQAAVTIEAGQKNFMRVAAALLLRLRSSAQTKNKDVALVTVYKLVELSPFFSADMLEEFLPYTFVRAAYHNLYIRKTLTAAETD